MSLYRGLPFSIFERIFMDRYVDGGLDEVQRGIVRAHLGNDDEEGAMKMLLDWGRFREAPPEPKIEPTCEISKFSPGDHYYTLGEKFNSRAEAEAHAKAKGYKVVRFFEVPVPDEKPLGAGDEDGWSYYD